MDASHLPPPLTSPPSIPLTTSPLSIPPLPSIAASPQVSPLRASSDQLSPPPSPFKGTSPPKSFFGLFSPKKMPLVESFDENPKSSKKKDRGGERVMMISRRGKARKRTSEASLASGQSQPDVSSHQVHAPSPTLSSFHSLPRIQTKCPKEETSFDWSLFFGIEGIQSREYGVDEVVVGDNIINNTIYRLLSGTVKLEKTLEISSEDEEPQENDPEKEENIEEEERKLTNNHHPVGEGEVVAQLGVVSSTDDWPILCEMSALSVDNNNQGGTVNHPRGSSLTSCRVVAKTKCLVQLIPVNVLLRVLYSKAELGNIGFRHAVLFYETICRRYAAKLQSIHDREVALSASSNRARGPLSACLTVNGEGVIYSWSCSTTRNQSKNREGVAGEDAVVIYLTQSYLALQRKEGKKKRRIHSANSDDEPFSFKVLRLGDIRSISRHKRGVKISWGNERVMVGLSPQDGESLIEAVMCDGFLGESEEGRRGDGRTALSLPSNDEEGFSTGGSTETPDTANNFFGLNDVDFEVLKSRSRVVNIPEGEVVCCEGTEVPEVMYVLQGECVGHLSGENRKVFFIPNGSWIGELGYLLSTPPSASVYGGPGGCTLLSIPHSVLISLSRSSPKFLVRLYQTFLYCIWMRIGTADQKQIEKTKGKFRIDHEITCVLPSSAGPLPSNSPPSSPRDVLALEGEGANTGEEDIYIAEVSMTYPQTRDREEKETEKSYPKGPQKDGEQKDIPSSIRHLEKAPSNTIYLEKEIGSLNGKLVQKRMNKERLLLALAKLEGEIGQLMKEIESRKKTLGAAGKKGKQSSKKQKKSARGTLNPEEESQKRRTRILTQLNIEDPPIEGEEGGDRAKLSFFGRSVDKGKEKKGKRLTVKSTRRAKSPVKGVPPGRASSQEVPHLVLEEEEISNSSSSTPSFEAISTLNEELTDSSYHILGSSSQPLHRASSNPSTVGAIFFGDKNNELSPSLSSDQPASSAERSQRALSVSEIVTASYADASTSALPTPRGRSQSRELMCNDKIVSMYRCRDDLVVDPNDRPRTLTRTSSASLPTKTIGSDGYMEWDVLKRDSLWSDSDRESDLDPSDSEGNSTPMTVGGGGFQEGTVLSTWTKRFQDCTKKLSSVTIESNLDEVIKANTQLMHLSDDFVYAARTFGRIIISEVFLPHNKKTISPTTIGGIVGGEKYVVHGILFKFAFDNDRIFGGSDAAAAKVSDQELKGMMSFFALELPSLFFPMVALVKHHGYTLVAMSLLPVTRSTLVYGSHDGGVTVHNSNNAFSEQMETAGNLLNLRQHICGSDKKVEKLWVAADIEGHVGVDGQRYLLDFGRAMPPVTPNKNFYNCHIYQLFRREFVAAYKKPLCSDAYSGFVIHDSNLKEYNRDIDEATQYLFSTVIPKCGKVLLDRVMKYRDQTKVVEILHQHGINLRYIGRIINTYRSQNLLETMYGSETIEIIVNSLLIEAMARVIKNQMNAKMRQIRKEFKEPVEVVYRERSVALINLVFGESEESRRWWTGPLTEDLLDHFSVGRYIVVSSRKTGVEYSSIRKKLWHQDGNGGGLRYSLFERVVSLCALQVTDDARRKLRDAALLHLPEPLDLLDVVELKDRVKHMEIVSRTKGVFFQLKAAKESDPAVAISLLKQSVVHFNCALSSMPTNREALFQCGVSWYRLLELSSHEQIKQSASSSDLTNCGDLITDSSFEGEFSKEPQATFFDISDPNTQEAEQLYRRLLMVDRNNATSLALCGKFFSSCHKFEVAEECLLSALESDPTSKFARVCYGVFLYLHSNPSMGLKVLNSLGEEAWGGSSLDYLLGREWLVKVEVFMADGSSFSPLMHVNSNASSLVLQLSQMKAQKDAVIVEVRSEKSMNHQESLRFSDLVSSKRTTARILELEELPWVLSLSKGVVLYYVSRQYLKG